MPIDVIFGSDQQGVEYRSRGIVDLGDFVEAHALLHSDRERLAGLRYLLVDSSGISGFRMSAGDIRKLVTITRSNVSIVDDGAIAVVAPQPAAFGMARMWELLAWTPYSTRVFRDRPSAIAWLRREMARRQIDADVASGLLDVGAEACPGQYTGMQASEYTQVSPVES